MSVTGKPRRRRDPDPASGTGGCRGRSDSFGDQSSDAVGRYGDRRGQSSAFFLVDVAGHLFEQGADFLGLAGVERVRLQQVEDQQAGLSLVELVDQVVDPLLPDFLGA